MEFLNNELTNFICELGNFEKIATFNTIIFEKLTNDHIFQYLAAALIVVGAILYHEVITPSKVIGVTLCMIEIYFINK